MTPLPVTEGPAEIGGEILTPTFNLYAARALRDFGDGFVAVLLPVYLLALGFTPLQVGVVASAALLGSALLTLAIGFFGVRYDHRQLLIGAACLMVATGIAFAIVNDYAILLVIALLGTVNPSGGSVSIFVPMEHAVLAREVSDTERTKAFARYSLVGSLAGAVGALVAATPEALATFGQARLAGIKLMFVLYAVLGGGRRFLLCSCPAARSITRTSCYRAARAVAKHRVQARGFIQLDSFAGGFVVQSLLALWLFERFDLSLAAASLFFFWSGVLSAFSFPVAAWMSRHIGLVNTMVYTHIPSSICLILAAFATSLPIALMLLLIRSALSQMDVPTRSSYVMAVVTASERAAAASFTSVPRSLAASVIPRLPARSLRHRFAPGL